MLDIKNILLEACYQFVEEKTHTIQKRIQSLQNDLLSETKSSAGDKHETGRAMLHIEIEKSAQQLSSVNQMRETLDKIDITNKSDVIRLGSIVKTSQSSYFLSISIGQLKVENKTYVAISTLSPIGKKLIGKKRGETLFFNGMKIQIDAIS